MKLCLLADLHFGARNDHPQYLEHFVKFYKEQFFPWVSANRPDRIIVLGDVFDRRRYINGNTLAAVREHFVEPLEASEVRADVITGNHDCFFKNTSRVNWLSQLYGNSLDGVSFHWKPTWVKGLGLLIPWVSPDEAELSETVIQAGAAEPYVFGHFDFKGFDMGFGKLAEHDTIDRSKFSKFRGVFTGHYHKRQSKANVHYIGAPYEQNWGDVGGDFGFAVLDTETGQLDYVNNKERMHHNIPYADDPAMPKAFPEIRGKMVRLVIEKMENAILYERTLKALQDAAPAHLTVVERPETKTIGGADVDLRIDTTSDIIKKCVRALTTSVDKDQLEDLLLNLYSEAIKSGAEG